MSDEQDRVDLDTIEAHAKADCAWCSDGSLVTKAEAQALVARARDDERILREMRADIERLRDEVSRLESTNRFVREAFKDTCDEIAAKLGYEGEPSGDRLVALADQIKREHDELQAKLVAANFLLSKPLDVEGVLDVTADMKAAMEGGAAVRICCKCGERPAADMGWCNECIEEARR